METILELLKTFNSTTLIIVISILSIFVEISPIKFNPLSYLLKWIGDTINKDTKEKLSDISTKLEDVSIRIDKIEINNMRSSILDFSNSCMNKEKHTKEEFEHIIDLHTQYEKTIEEKGLKNGRIDLAFKYISDLYTKCLNNDNFLDN